MFALLCFHPAFGKELSAISQYRVSPTRYLYVSLPLSSAVRDRSGQTIPQLNTPFNNPDEERAAIVEVMDPTHPLFGRRFSVISYSTQPDAQYVSVLYQEYMTLRISLSATNLVPAQPRVSIKLTLAAIQELISVAEAEEDLCQSRPETSGGDCLQNCKPKFLPNSQPFSRK